MQKIESEKQKSAVTLRQQIEVELAELTNLDAIHELRNLLCWILEQIREREGERSKWK
jgi:hypothetical protein